MASYTAAQADQQAEILLEAGRQSPCRIVAYELRRRSREWARAVTDLLEAHEVADILELDGLEPRAVIEMVGACGPGTPVLHATTEGDWKHVTRVILRDGQASLHLDDERGGPGIYRNFLASSSPVVVRA